MARLSRERLEKLSTQRLYQILKIARGNLDSGFFCSCCATPNWQLHGPSEKDLFGRPRTQQAIDVEWDRRRSEWEREFEEAKGYFDDLKAILATRPHLDRKGPPPTARRRGSPSRRKDKHGTARRTGRPSQVEPETTRVLRLIGV